ncbi:MAG TPA: SDR family oxidoreductase [Acidiferrobacteraceae bacterium]|nr:SDR family oxidoreductase [Acidiferrobacteraceae bacterium]
MTTRRSVLITGGARRMGAAQARILAAAGWDVCLHCHTSREAATQLAEVLMREFGVRAVVVSADLADGAAVTRLVPDCAAALGRPVTALVNNASTFEYDEVQSFALAQFDATLRVNLTAPLLLARALAAQGGRVIVNILDQKIENLNPDFFSYTVSKQALAAATHLLARALLPVRVCAVAPGLSLPSSDQTADEFAAAHAMAPLGRGSHPQDVAEAVRFLLEAEAITDQILFVDGGQHLHQLNRDVLFVQRGKGPV